MKGSGISAILAHIVFVKTMDSPPLHDVISTGCIQIHIPLGHFLFQLKTWFVNVIYTALLCFVTLHPLFKLAVERMNLNK